MPSTPSIAPEILQILRCPATGSPLIQRGDFLIAADHEQIRYPIQHGVPTLLTDSTETEGHR